MTKPEQIKTSVDAILEIVEKLKTNIKDNEYIKLMDQLKIINDNNAKSNIKRYELTFLKLSTTIIKNCYADEDDPDEMFTIRETIKPTFEVIKQSFLLSKETKSALNEKVLENMYFDDDGLGFGVTPYRVKSFSKEISDYMYKLEETESHINTYERHCQNCRILNIIHSHMKLIHINEREDNELQ